MSLIDTSSVLTELDAVNALLNALGYLPVTTLEPSTSPLPPEAVTVMNTLARERVAMNNEGYICSLSEKVTLPLLDYEVQPEVIVPASGTDLLPTITFRYVRSVTMGVIAKTFYYHGIHNGKPIWFSYATDAEVVPAVYEAIQWTGTKWQYGYWDGEFYAPYAELTPTGSDYMYPPKGSSWEVTDTGLSRLAMEDAYVTWTSTAVVDSGDYGTVTVQEELRENRIKIPSNVLKVSAHWAFQRLTARGGWLYDLRKNSYVFDMSPDLDVVYDFSFEDLPPSARGYIVTSAGASLAMTLAGGDTQLRDDFRTQMSTYFGQIIGEDIASANCTFLQGTNYTFQ